MHRGDPRPHCFLLWGHVVLQDAVHLAKRIMAMFGNSCYHFLLRVCQAWCCMFYLLYQLLLAVVPYAKCWSYPQVADEEAEVQRGQET